MNAILPFTTQATSHPMTQCHIPEHHNVSIIYPLYLSPSGLKPWTYLSFYTYPISKQRTNNI